MKPINAITLILMLGAFAGTGYILYTAYNLIFLISNLASAFGLIALLYLWRNKSIKPTIINPMPKSRGIHEPEPSFSSKATSPPKNNITPITIAMSAPHFPLPVLPSVPCAFILSTTNQPQALKTYHISGTEPYNLSGTIGQIRGAGHWPNFAINVEWM